ncbi:MAG TPA: phosphatidylinositol-specific phospholipase C domain-containing protein, partial [Puia sp.]|nr:phosphatidylinositol-specific phospholipase C domain-containing protein [Puia sp.]
MGNRRKTNEEVRNAEMEGRGTPNAEMANLWDANLNSRVWTNVWTHVRWMTVLPDDLPISEINIPGAHNAAAIHPVRRTRWACQCHPIGEQLRRGIRLLDIRLKPKVRSGRASMQSRQGGRRYEFVTCHGRRGLPGQNEFQRFETLQKECVDFLQENPGETIIMSIQVDDWRRVRRGDRAQVLEVLRRQLHEWPIFAPAHLPTLGECRGKIFLINRINDDPTLGVPLDIPDNTPGATLPATEDRRYEVYVQDQYRGLDRRNPEAHKLRLTLGAFEQKKAGVVLLNFAS